MSDNVAFKSKIATLEMDRTTITSELDTLATANAALSTTVADLSQTNVTLIEQVDAIAEAQQTAAEAALIEDYFFTNDDETINVAVNTDFMLVEPFCIEGSTTFKFELSANVQDNPD